MPTYQDNQSFIKSIFETDHDLLSLALEWIRKNMTPGDVFEENDLYEWAVDNGYVKKEK